MNLRHPNGRGLLLDDAEANRGTFISRDSSASGYAKLRDCSLFGSRAEGNCQIYTGNFHNSVIKGKTVCACNRHGVPYIANSILDCSEVSGNPVIYNAHLIGTTEVCDSPLLKGNGGELVLRNAIIYGEPYIIMAGEVSGRVHEGTWTRPPKHIKLPWCDLSECIDGKVLLDCRCRHFDYWMRHGTRLARRWGWSEDMIAVTINTIGREFSIPQPANMVYSPVHGETILS